VPASFSTSISTSISSKGYHSSLSPYPLITSRSFILISKFPLSSTSQYPLEIVTSPEFETVPAVAPIVTEFGPSSRLSKSEVIVTVIDSEVPAAKELIVV